MNDCPCSSGKDFTECCGPILNGAPAPTAEALMRSRYSAYATGDMAHLRRSLHPSKRKRFDEKKAAQWSADCVWTGLSVLDTADGGPKDTRGEVEFIARFEHDGQPHEMHERGLFSREGAEWFYVQGMQRTVDQQKTAKVGRNDPCPCGSGKKYKKCCGS